MSEFVSPFGFFNRLKNSGLVLGLLFLFAGWAQAQRVPAAVENTFESMFPGMSQVEWEVEHNQWEAEFHVQGQEKEAVFAEDGTFLYLETEIDLAEVPAVMKEKFAESFPGETPLEAERVEMSDGRTLYVLESRHRKMEGEISMDMDGNEMLILGDDHEREEGDEEDEDE